MNPKNALGEKGDFTRISDDCFDLTVSMFGAMFAPKAFDVARGTTSIPATFLRVTVTP